MNARNWLLTAALITEFIGLATALGALIPGALDPVVALLYLPPVEVALDRYGRLLAGMMGGVMAGWGTSMALLARRLDDLTPVVVARALAIGAGTWFCVDGLATIINGAYLNLVANTAFLALLLLPCLAIVRSDGRVQPGQATAA